MYIIPSFVQHRSRIKGHKLDTFFNTMLPAFGVKSFAEIESIMHNFESVSIEIGSGYGDTLAHIAKLNPKTLYIGCEVYRDGLYSTCYKANEENIANIRLFTQDARLLLAQTPKQTIHETYLLFPDPWPKPRHHKRRIFNYSFLEEQHRILKTGGKIFIATDSDLYKQHMAQVILNQTLFSWVASRCEDFVQTPPWWHKTKFQNKAEIAGSNCVFIELVKV